MTQDLMSSPLTITERLGRGSPVESLAQLLPPEPTGACMKALSSGHAARIPGHTPRAGDEERQGQGGRIGL